MKPVLSAKKPVNPVWFYTKFTISINIFLMLAAYGIAKIAGSLPILGSPAIILTISMFITNYLAATEVGDKLKPHTGTLILLISFIQLLILFARLHFTQDLAVTPQQLSIMAFTAFFATMVTCGVMIHFHYRYILHKKEEEELSKI